MYKIEEKIVPKFSQGIIFCLILSSIVIQIKAKEHSYSTSVVRMIELLKMEKLFIQATTEQIEKMQKRIDFIKGIIEDMQILHSKSDNNPEEYLSNPLNSYSLIRRMHEDWSRWIKYLNQTIMNEHLIQLKNSKDLPTLTDMSEAAEGFQRIQKYYEMNPIYLAEGIYDKQEDNPFSYYDMYKIGSQLLKLNYINDSILWLESAISKSSQSNEEEIAIIKERHGFEKLSLYKDYIRALLEGNQVKKALNITFKTLSKYPFDKELWFMKNEVDGALYRPASLKRQPDTSQDFDSEFARVCRGDGIMEIFKTLHCYYDTTKVEYYKLAPFRVEKLSQDPFVAIYHDAVSTIEIEYLKKLAKLTLKRATVFLLNEPQGLVTNIRTVHDTWLNPQLTTKITKRIGDMTGFEERGFEPVSILNYGIGGYYDAHYDFFYPDVDPYIIEHGERMATTLIYLNDVEVGGGTGFPLLNLLVTPTKGSLLLWYNQENNGVTDNRTLHGSCPVVKGSKWVGTIWIRDHEQFRNKPCYKDTSLNI